MSWNPLDTAGQTVNGQVVPGFLEDISAQRRTNYMGFVSFTVLIWDHIDTFSAEVEYIWYGTKGPVTYLFLLNRYLTPLGFMVNLFAYLSPVWTPEVCSRFIRYEGAMTMIGINVVAIMMFMRIYVLYHTNRLVLSGVGLVLLFQICMNGWLLTHGEAVVHNPASGIRSCTMIFDPSISVLASSSAWLPLLYDTIVFTLVVLKTLPSIRDRYRGFTARLIMTRLLEDGLIYYTVIFSVTLVLTLMIIFAQPGLKNITAQLELLLTVAMMSRITLNLKKSVGKLSKMDPDEQVTFQLSQSIAYARNWYTPKAAVPRSIPLREIPKANSGSINVNTETEVYYDESTRPLHTKSVEAVMEDGRLR